MKQLPTIEEIVKMSKQNAFDAGRAYEKSLVEEKSYTRDEVAMICKKYGEDCIKYINSQSPFIEGGFHKNWILQNL